MKSDRLRIIVSLLGIYLALAAANDVTAERTLILPAEVVAAAEQASPVSDLVILGNEPIRRPLIGPAPEFVPRPQGHTADFVVKNQQVGIRIEEPVFITPSTTVSWFWRKEQGKVCISAMPRVPWRKPGRRTRRLRSSSPIRCPKKERRWNATSLTT
jgi:hypothetical protein